MRKTEWQNLPSLTPKWSGPFKVAYIYGFQCWLQDAIGRVTREGVHISCIRPYVVRH